MTHNCYNNDSNSLEISNQNHEVNLKLDVNNSSSSSSSSNNELENEIKQKLTSNNNDLNKTSDINTSIDEKFDKNQSISNKKRKHRRGKKRRNHRINPYRLSNSEYEKKECERLQRNREKMVKQGKTLAPFNTTQFIMDEHRNEIPVFDSVNSSDIDSDTTAEADLRDLSNEFNEEYEIIKLDYYRNLPKDKLLDECFQILNELNRLQDTVAKLTNENDKLKSQLLNQTINQTNGYMEH